jgi:hypothetical protein
MSPWLRISSAENSSPRKNADRRGSGERCERGNRRADAAEAAEVEFHPQTATICLAYRNARTPVEQRAMLRE